MNAYAVIIEARADRDLTEKQPVMAWIEAGASRSSLAYHSGTRWLRLTLHVDAETVPGAVAEAFRVTGRAVRVAGFGYETEELRVFPSARLEAETMRLLAPVTAPVTSLPPAPTPAPPASSAC